MSICSRTPLKSQNYHLVIGLKNGQKNETDPDNGGNGGQPDSFDLQCCGNYPDRKPYREVGYDAEGNIIAEKSCCNFDNGAFGDSVYDVNQKMCCDGVIMDFGNIC